MTGINARAWKRFALRSGIVVAVIGVRFWIGGAATWLTNLWLAVGWSLGYWLTDVDDLFYVYVCNPKEMTCQRVREEAGRKNWRRAWEILVDSRPERQKLPVHNVLTGLVVALAGVWLTTSNGNMIANGAILGLSSRLLLGLMLEKDYNRWYWVFARDFSREENRLIKLVWGVMVVIQIWMLVRR